MEPNEFWGMWVDAVFLTYVLFDSIWGGYLEYKQNSSTWKPDPMMGNGVYFTILLYLISFGGVHFFYVQYCEGICDLWHIWKTKLN